MIKNIRIAHVVIWKVYMKNPLIKKLLGRARRKSGLPIFCSEFLCQSFRIKII